MTTTTACPVCRGEIHAIAGRCKHCKADLVELREQAARMARAQAMGAVVPPPQQPASPAPAMYRWTGAPAAPPPQDASSAAAGAPTIPDAPPQQAPAAPPPVAAPPQHPPPQQHPPAAPSAGRVPGLPPALVSPPAAGEPWAGAPRARRASWSRRWPLVVSAVALLAIGVSIGMLAERWRSQKSDDGDGHTRNASVQPHRIPDPMPQPLLPGPAAPRPVPDDPPDDPQARVAPDPVPDPGFSIPDPAPAPGSRFGQGSPGPGDASAFRTFTASLTESLCRKLSECGVIDSATQSVCHAFADEFDPDDAAARVARGECSFNQRAADACLRAVADLRCDATASGDMMEWLMASNRVGECAQAFTCQ